MFLSEGLMSSLLIEHTVPIDTNLSLLKPIVNVCAAERQINLQKVQKESAQIKSIRDFEPPS